MIAFAFKDELDQWVQTELIENSHHWNERELVLAIQKQSNKVKRLITRR